MKPEFYLLSKTTGQKYNKLHRAQTLKLTKGTPYSVDEVVLAVKGQIGKERKVTTFRDRNGNVIERAFDYYDKPYIKNRVYSSRNSDISDFETVVSKNIKEYTLNKNLISTYKQLKAYQPGTEVAVLKEKLNLTNHIARDIDTGEKFFSQTIITPKTPILYSLHKFVEYPSIYQGHKTCYPKKELSFVVNNKTNTVVKGSEQATNVKVPKKDSYLAYRALGIDELKVPITERYIKERGLLKAEIEINTNYCDKNRSETLAATASYFDGSIAFNKLHQFESKADVVDSARHEVEHIWQYSLDGRRSAGINSPFARRVYKIFGPIRDKKLKVEADKYSKAIDEYVEYDVDFDKYYNNYLEKMARKVAEKIKQQYIKEGAEIRKSFPHIPEDIL